MKAGWKNRIEERRYMEAKLEARAKVVLQTRALEEMKRGQEIELQQMKEHSKAMARLTEYFRSQSIYDR